MSREGTRNPVPSEAEVTASTPTVSADDGATAETRFSTLDFGARAVVRPVRARLELADVSEHTRDFHRRLPGYEETPLRSCPQISSSLGLGEVWVKDETRRFGLPAFKILGTFYGVYKLLVQRVGKEPRWDTVGDLRRWASQLSPLSLSAATDGNHGRAVAHMAALFGFGATIYVPAGMSAARIESIEKEGAAVVVVDGDYDDAVRRAAQDASERCLVVSDTSWPGYTDVPTWVMDGYATVFAEIREQLVQEARSESFGEAASDLLLVPTGVGALLGSALRSMKANDTGPSPVIVSVEPIAADCVARSFETGKMVHVPGPHPSMMVGLNCGTPSQVAWPRISRALDGAVSIGDGWAAQAMCDLSASGIVAGETGAASLAGLTALCRSPKLAEAKAALRLGPRSRVLLLCTEGATDPRRYRQIVGRSPESEVSTGI